MFHEKTGVFNDEEAGCAGLGGGFGVGNPQLEPECFGANGDGRVNDPRNIFGAAEDVDDVDGDGYVFEACVGFFTKDLGFVGVDGDDGIAGALKVGGDFVRRAHRIRRESHDGDRLGGTKQVGDAVERLVHSRSMTETGNWVIANR